MLKDWFAPPRIPKGLGQATCAFRIPRSGDERLLGSWSDCRPTDLTEWRQWFRRVPRIEPPGTDDASSPPTADTRLPRIEIEDTPLRDVIRNLARHFAVSDEIAKALVLHASAHLALSNAPVALRDATALFRLAESLRGQTDLIGGTVQAMLIGHRLQVIWEGLAGRRWSARDLETLESQLQSIDLWAACQLGLEVEVAAWNRWLEQTSRAQLAETIVECMTTWRMRRQSKPLWVVPLEWNVRWIPHGWIRQIQIGFTEAIQDQLAALDARRQWGLPTSGQPASGLRRPSAVRAGPVADWCHRSILHGFQLERTSTRVQSGVNLARTACALERYRLVHGRYPDKLDGLGADIPKRLPRDLMNGRPLQYAPTDDGQFVLYSVGWDGEDNGGNGADWVWRYPSR